jgi:CRP/FNR family nitrogen fixation transcriptional regulator
MFDLSATSSAGVDLLDTLGVIAAFAPNREIYAESEPATDLYRIISGAVRSYKILDDGRRDFVPGRPQDHVGRAACRFP